MTVPWCVSCQGIPGRAGRVGTVPAAEHGTARPYCACGRSVYELVCSRRFDRLVMGLVVANLLIDVLIGLIDPRLRMKESR